MRDGTSSVLENAHEAETAASDSRGDQIASLVDKLESSAKDSQQSVSSLLAQESDSSTSLFSSSKSFWITNQVYVKDATAELLIKLMGESNVAEIREEAIFSIEEPTSVTVLSDSAITVDTNGSVAVGEAITAAWGVAKIGAVDVWAKGFTGENVVVATIDTGVRSTHQSLRDNFLGDYGWFDPVANTTTPTDGAGHGTHVTGLIAGTKGIGVAPGSKWMACRGCATADTCAEAAMLSCAQFVLCPTDVAGSSASRNCSKAPHIINNSWGGPQGDTTFASVIQAWRQAGIIPLFASGNIVANGCGTVRSPADNADVIGVGATTSTDSLWAYSAMGPTPAGLLKPEVVAPGSEVYSAWRTRDNVYAIASGTSMAAPHAAGVAALLLGAQPNMTFDEVRSALEASANRTSLVSASRTCGNTSDSEFPNNIFGYGRVDALAAISKLGF
jgi:subtilisin family serine protease